MSFMKGMEGVVAGLKSKMDTLDESEKASIKNSIEKHEKALNTTTDPGCLYVPGCPKLQGVLEKTCYKTPGLMNLFMNRFKGDKLDAFNEYTVLNGDFEFFKGEEWASGKVLDTIDKMPEVEKKADKVRVIRNKIWGRCPISKELLCDAEFDVLEYVQRKMSENFMKQIERIIINGDYTGTLMPNLDANNPITDEWSGLMSHAFLGTETYTKGTGYTVKPDSQNVKNIGGLFNVKDICTVTDMIGCDSSEARNLVLIVPRKIFSELQKQDCLICKDTAGDEATLFGNSFTTPWGHTIYESQCMLPTDENGVHTGDPAVDLYCNILAVQRDAIIRGFGCDGIETQVDSAFGCGLDVKFCAHFGFGVCDGQADSGRTVAAGTGILNK